MIERIGIFAPRGVELILNSNPKLTPSRAGISLVYSVNLIPVTVSAAMVRFEKTRSACAATSGEDAVSCYLCNADLDIGVSCIRQIRDSQQQEYAYESVQHLYKWPPTVCDIYRNVT